MNQILAVVGKLLQKTRKNSEKSFFEKRAKNPDD